MLINNLAEILNSPQFDPNFDLNSFSIDTRSLKPGDCFIAIQGENFDGHDFIQAAEAAGAAAVITQKAVVSTLPVLQVEDTRLALGQIAANHRDKFNVRIIALTGSNGKTTVKEMIASILSECGSVLATQGNFNNDIGVPLSLLRLNEKHQFAVFELGANHPGEIAYVSGLVKPDVAMITNVAPAHLEGFGSIENVAKAKGEIYQSLRSEGIAVLNADDAFAGFWEKGNTERKVIHFAMDKQAEYSARLLHINELGCATIVMKTVMDEVRIQLPLFGQHQIMNALAAAAATASVGATVHAIKAGLEKMQAVSGRMVRKSGLQDAIIIDDTYNANLVSTKAALEYLATRPSPRIFVLGDMRELGADALQYHEEVGKLAKKLGIETLMSYGDFSMAASEAFGEGAHHFEKQEPLINALQSQLTKQTTVLVKGSRGSHMEYVVDALMKEE